MRLQESRPLGKQMSHRIRYIPGLQLLTRAAGILGLRDWPPDQFDPDGLRHIATILVWAHWLLGGVSLFQIVYRPYYMPAQYAAYLVMFFTLMAYNGYIHNRLLSNREITWRWILSLKALDIAVFSGLLAIGGGFSHYFFYLYYYPALACFALIFTSFRFNLLWVTTVAAIYLGICLSVGDGVDFEARDEKPLLMQIAVMYTIVIGINLVSRFERSRWREAVERERVLLRERTDLAQAIHSTMAQSAYMIGLGIDRAKNLADKSNKNLMSTLEETSTLSKSAMWELRHPIEIGEIFDGMELGGVLESLVATFSTISSVPAEFVQSGDEPPLPTATRGALFSIAHNALTNALRHSNASHVRISLDFNEVGLRLSISDDGVGLPPDYGKRGRGFRNMREDAERAGGSLLVESGVGTTVTCVAPYNKTRRS